MTKHWRGGRQDSAQPVILDGDPGAVPWPPVTARLNEADDPLAVAAPAFQELEHAIDVDGFPDQGPSNIFDK
ncbi:hypothetical protein [Leifsonia xyli]|uniref:hypothetical protein n=1 Tax=Leifsonia xyli TaxID=1575 RepID=UPI003D67D3AA